MDRLMDDGSSGRRPWHTGGSVVDGYSSGTWGMMSMRQQGRRLKGGAGAGGAASEGGGAGPQISVTDCKCSAASNQRIP